MPIDHFPFSTNGGGIYRPWLSLRIINPHTGLSLTTYGLVDTGADECAIPASFAHLLGHDLCKGSPKGIQTGNGETASFSHTTTFEILLPGTGQMVYRAENTPVDFLPNLFTVLIGVKNFLGKFVLSVDYPGRVFSIKHPAARSLSQGG